MALRLPAFLDSSIPPQLTRPLETWLGLASPGNYSGAALTAALTASNNATGPTVYVGNLPTTASFFLSFLDGSTAGAFHADATIKKLSLHGQELKIGWGEHLPSPIRGASLIHATFSSL
ncbi:hypothetical protein EDB84DRAFT_1564790 [Lactarius hengduanensis]|nr:hypothetical protein EDB84DRAFT_1569339 [Lactarius hengduanensis]KAH9023269.1 hypothetical protein EDB84DRAFT_1564790 [Lactarius hengduanensis]